CSRPSSVGSGRAGVAANSCPAHIRQRQNLSLPMKPMWVQLSVPFRFLILDFWASHGDGNPKCQGGAFGYASYSYPRGSSRGLLLSNTEAPIQIAASE